MSNYSLISSQDRLIIWTNQYKNLFINKEWVFFKASGDFFFKKKTLHIMKEIYYLGSTVTYIQKVLL